jgi:polysaccharide pyruvyl transferase WcaK-like protein
MTTSRTVKRRVGLFGRLASGNIGNDVSMESVLAYLRAEHPDIIVDAMCPAPERMKARYGIDAVELFWRPRFGPRAPMPVRAVFLMAGKCADAFRIAGWVRRHDVAIIPGMGVLEAALPIRPWETPYAMFLLSAYGRLFGTKVALVSVGAGPVRQRSTRWLLDWAARLADYRSYRDVQSVDAMAERGVDPSRDPLYPDLAFGIPVPPYDPGEARTVGIGVMAYSGSNEDRDRAARIHAAYVAAMNEFTGWLLDHDYRVRLFVGDGDDEPVANEILEFLRSSRPDVGEDRLSAAPVASFDELTQVMQQVAMVVATRFHNVVCAVRLAKPTISLSYAPKSAAIMADAGLEDFNMSANPLDARQLIERFRELERRAADLVPGMRESVAAKALQSSEQFALLTKTLFR